MEIVRKLLSTDEITPPNIRYDPMTDKIEFSPDGGVTWNVDEAADPRHNPASLFPPLSGGDARCDAAANMVAMLQGFVQTILDVLDYLALVNALAGLFAKLIGLIGWIISLIIAIVDGLLAIGRVAIADAFTEDVYDQILCVLYCYIGDDGQVSAAQLALINDRIYEIDPTVGQVWNYTMTGLGEVGLSNAGASGSETGDCEDCECQAACAYDFTIDEQGFTESAWEDFEAVGAWNVASPPFDAGWFAGTGTHGTNDMAMIGDCETIRRSRGFSFTGEIYGGAAGSFKVSLFTSGGTLLATGQIEATGFGFGYTVDWEGDTIVDADDVTVKIGYHGSSGYGAVLTGLVLTT